MHAWVKHKIVLDATDMAPGLGQVQMMMMML